MFRLFKYLPIVVPLAMRFFRSPEGKAVIERIRPRGAANPGTPPESAPRQGAPRPRYRRR